MMLTIVIPAFNEEDAIGSTIERCLAAREQIVSDAPVDAVEVIVVSDGSTDRTVEIAGRYPGIRLIAFERNRGYGAAIKRGFAEGTGDLVGFLDADGTCDPNFFAALCTALIEEDASVALGSRLGADSEMPRVRRLGNRGYALILSALSNRVVTDTASGMRVIRRSVLEQLYPLPDGLNFTPAMSARVLMDNRLTIVERPMSYRERIGESKLHVWRDGVRFLTTICEMTLMWRPAKVFVLTASLMAIFTTLLSMHPIETWVRRGRLEEDMIYRLLFCALLGAGSVTLLSAAVIGDNLHRLLADRPPRRTFLSMALDRAYAFRGFGIACAITLPWLVWLVGEGAWTRLAYGYVDLHWSRVVLAGLMAFSLAQMLPTVLIVNLIRFHAGRKSLRASSLPRATVSLPTSRLAGSTPVVDPSTIHHETNIPAP